ncbi:MAG: hypothetical protein R2867_45365 [Caldilineaceae bacterium]
MIKIFDTAAGKFKALGGVNRPLIPVSLWRWSVSPVAASRP